MATAKPAGRNPRELAGELADHLNADPPAHVREVRVEGPGFVNFHLDADLAPRRAVRRRRGRHRRLRHPRESAPASG